MGAITNFPDGASSFGVPMIGGIGGIPLTGTWYWVDPANGSDSFTGLSPQEPLATLYMAHSKMTAGKNDVCVLVGDGSTTGPARLSTALAQTVNSAATAGTLVWSKNACHLIGQTAPTGAASRARIAPPSGTYTQSTFGSGNFVTVSAQGCIFANFSLFNGFSTGGNNQICWTDSGGRNSYWGVQFGGAGDTASAQSTSSRSLLITGTTGENQFVNCTIGLDTVPRTVANASLEFAGGSPRNVFKNCLFPMVAGANSPLFITTAGAAAIDRFQWFYDCLFVNDINSSGTALTVGIAMAASAGGILVVQRCTLVGGNTSTNWGDATALTQIWVDGGAPTAGSTGLAVNPS
jgi:hypothetical protein